MAGQSPAVGIQPLSSYSLPPLYCFKCRAKTMIKVDKPETNRVSLFSASNVSREGSCESRTEGGPIVFTYPPKDCAKQRTVGGPIVFKYVLSSGGMLRKQLPRGPIEYIPFYWCRKRYCHFLVYGGGGGEAFLKS